MGAAAVGDAILPLVGVALGTAGTLTGQYLATRGESRRHADQRAAEIRAERKEAIIAFLDAAQRVEQLVDDRGMSLSTARVAVGNLVHALWLSKKLLELVCGFELASVAHKYASTLHTLAQAPSIDQASAGQHEYRAEFMEAARRELGVQGPRLYRSARGSIPSDQQEPRD